MRKLLSLAAIGALLSVSFVSSADEAWAVALPNAFSVDCSSGSTLTVGQTVAGVENDQFTITNTSTTTSCTVTVLDADVLIGATATTDAATETIAANNGTATFTIKTLSGGYTIEPTGSSSDAVIFAIDTDDCALDGAGIESAPFLVGTQANFQLVGEVGCRLNGHYLQTANLSLDNYVLDRVGDETAAFAGTYVGDHYQISLAGTFRAGDRDTGIGFGSPIALFPVVTDGTIKRVRISGNIYSSAAVVGGLVGYLNGTTPGDAVISEVRSSVGISLSGDGVVAGGIVGKIGDAQPSGLIQYSKATNTIEWLTAATTSATTGARLGGLVGAVEGTSGTQEIRDSYSQAKINFDSASLDVSGTPTIRAGGLLGEEMENAAVTLVRTYSVSPITDECAVGTCVTLDSTVATRYVGALVGWVDDDTYTDWTSNFYLVSGLAQNAVGVQAGIAQPDRYNNSTPGEPVAVPLSASLLKTRSTFQSPEDSVTADTPNGSADLSATSVFRWAIEGINAQTFVPSSYDTDGPGSYEGAAGSIGDYTKRVAYADTNVSREYRTLRAGVLSAHGGEEAATVVNYPDLGRVWDICDDYPTLVWEENNSCTGSGGSSSSSSSTDASANPGGLSDAEYAEYLASGLTLEQFLAARLAATGVPSSALSLGFGAMLAFLGLGVALVWVTRRERVAGRI